MTADLLRLVRRMGDDIPTLVSAGYTIGVLWACAIGVSILIWPVSRADRRDLVVLWAAKCLVALGFMLLTEYHYKDNDAFLYFERSLEPGSPFAWQGFRWGSGTMVVQTVAWYHSQYFLASYHALKVSFAAVGLVGLYLFYRAAVMLRGSEDRRMLYALALFPSLLFWSSLLGKDPLVLFGIALYTFGAIAWARTGSNLNLGMVLAGMLVVLPIRFWLIPVMAGAFAVLALRIVRGPARKAAVVLGTGLVVGWSIFTVADAFRIREARHVYRALAQITAGFEGISTPAVTMEITNFESLIRFLPVGMFTALFRPLPGEVSNAFGLLAGFENALLLALVVYTGWRIRLSAFRDPIVQWAITFIVLWSVQYAFLSSLNLGIAARMKIQVLPILLGLLLHLGAERRRCRAAGGGHAPSPLAPGTPEVPGRPGSAHPLHAA